MDAGVELDVGELVSLRRLAGLGAILSGGATIFAFQNFLALTMVPAGITVGLLLYSILGVADHSVSQTLATTKITDRRLPTVLTIVFLLASAVSVVSLTRGYYTKPLLYYLMIGTAGVALFFRIVLTDAVRTNVVLVVLFGLNTFGSNQIVFPQMRGPDGGYHIELVRYIYETGFVVESSATYAGFPGQHLGPAMAANLTGLSPESTYLLFGTALMLIGSFLTYCVGLRLANQEYALLAMLIYASMSYVVYRGGHPTQQAHILPIFFLLYVAAIYLYFNPSLRNRLAFIVAGLMLIATHHHTSLIAVIMLGALLVGFLGAKYVQSLSDIVLAERIQQVGSAVTEKAISHGLLILVLFSTIFYVHLTITSGYLPSLAGYVLSFIQSLLGAETSGSLAGASRFAAIPPRVFLINTTGEGILVFLVVLGGLTHLVYQDRIGIMMIVWLAFAGALALLGVVIEFPFIIPQRIYVMAQMTAMGFLAATGLVYLLNQGHASARQSVAAVGLVAGVVFLLIFFSTASTVAGIETSPFNQEVLYPIEYQVAEEDQTREFWNQVGEAEAELQWAHQLPANEHTIDYSTVEEGAIGVSYHRIDTGVTVHGGSGIGAASYVSPSNPTEGLENNRKFYDNGPVELYYIS
ncbi:hypothetical protein HWV23_15495 [Natronomonas halophila]|uniref:hypothetical protein n=1 Tax=Natronomonas halophila TaxID=2747817 RepID=UPI0015B6A3BE|nr:hypothetical protein [Natronomonas halophila]QLD87067.1 hypothetical protein HWV23_15495 [Natronomonas halophila]